MPRWARSPLPLLLLAALATAPCNPAGPSASRESPARIAAGRDDVTVRPDHPHEGASWRLDPQAEEQGAASGSRHISTRTPLREADATADGAAQGVRWDLKKAHPTDDEEQAAAAKVEAFKDGLQLLRRGEKRKSLMTASASASLSPPTPTLIRLRRQATGEDRKPASKKLLEAVQSGDQRSIPQLLAQGADVHYRNEQRETALHWAAMFAQTDAVRLLVDAGAPVDARNVHFYAPLNWAAISGCVGCIKTLASAGANVNARNKDGWTPLHEAALYNQEKAVKALLAVGADPAIRNGERRPPRDYTTSNAVRALLPKFD